MSDNLIIFEDGYAFLDVTDKAKDIFVLSMFPLYEVRVDEQTESLIETYKDLSECLKKGGVIGIELGVVNKK